MGRLAFQAFPRPPVPGCRTWTTEEAMTLDRLIEPIQAASEQVCERCGGNGALRDTRPILVVLCDACDVQVLQR